MERIIRRLRNFRRNPKRSFYVAISELNRKCPRLVSDKLCVKAQFYINMGYDLDLRHPKTFSEKLQWLKLYNRRPEYTQMVDKYEAKKYVASIIGNEHIIPTLAVYNSTSEINLDALPDRFVLKCTHDSGSVAICKDKRTFQKEKAFAMLEEGLKRNFFWEYREWPYKNVPRRIIAEKFIDPVLGMNDLPDYKFFCFNGEPRYCQVISGRDTKMSIDFFDIDWNHQPFHEPKIYPFAEVMPQRPENYDKMWEAARRLAQNMPFARIDFYITGKHVFFGEITFFPTSGIGGFSPEEWDSQFGQWLKLPSKKIT